MAESLEAIDGALLEDLRNADRPIAPSAEFDARLRHELFGDGIALAPKDRRPSGRRPRMPVLVAAAAVLLAVVVGAVVVAGRDDLQDAVDGTSQDPTTTIAAPGVDRSAARSACEVFRAQAFGELTQVQVAGPNNATYLPTAEAVTTAATQLDTAIVQLRSGLSAAGLQDPDFVAQSDRARRSLAKSIELASQGSLPKAQDEMGQMDEHLERVARALTQDGVTGCV